MRVEGQATFNHEDGPFDEVLMAVTITPDTPAEHSKLAELVASPKTITSLVQDVSGFHVLVKLAMSKAPTIPTVKPKSTK